MVVSDFLQYMVSIGVLVALIEFVAVVLFLFVRVRRAPRYGGLLALLGLTAGALVVALATETVVCWAGGPDTCFAAESYATKAYLLAGTALMLLVALAAAPWRRPREVS